MNEIQALRYLLKMYGTEVKVISNGEEIKISEVLEEKIDERTLNTLHREEQRKFLVETSHNFNKNIGNYFKNIRILNQIKLKDVGKIAQLNGIHIKTLQSFENGDGVSLFKFLVMCNIYGINGGSVIANEGVKIESLNSQDTFYHHMKEKEMKIDCKEDVMKYVFELNNVKELVEMLDCVPLEIRESIVLKGVLREEKIVSKNCLKVSLFDVVQCVEYMDISAKNYLNQISMFEKNYNKENVIKEKEYQGL